MTTTDIALVGAGPIGIEMAVALKRAGLEYIHFEKRQIAQTIFWFPPQTRFFSSTERLAIAGVPFQTPDQSKCTREEYLAYLRSVVQQFDLDIRLYERVAAVEQMNGGFRLRTQKGGAEHLYQARRVILATGGTARPRPLGIEGEHLPHVSHYFHEPHTYFRTNLLVVGGKNSAVEAALRAHHAGARVAISYRRAEFDPKAVKYWLLPEINSLIKAGQIRAYFMTAPQAITPTHVTLAPLGGEEPFNVPADFVLLMVGYVADMCLCESAGAKLIGLENRPVFNEQTMESDVPGLYVAGTVTGGTQHEYSVFIENGHIHVGRILAALTGAPPPEPVKVAGTLEM